jgi:hypothetical protein
LIACKGDEPKVFQIDPLATVNIKPAAGTIMKVKSNVSVEHLTALEIVKQTELLRFTLLNGTASLRGFDPLQRDITSTTPMLKMWGTDILYYEQLIDGTFTDKLVLSLDFLEAKNCVLTSYKGDTLAYIPNTVLRSAETQIKALFAAKNYEPIYAAFNNAYTFIPISGAEYRALKQ